MQLKHAINDANEFLYSIKIRMNQEGKTMESTVNVTGQTIPHAIEKIKSHHYYDEKMKIIDCAIVSAIHIS